MKTLLKFLKYRVHFLLTIYIRRSLIVETSSRNLRGLNSYADVYMAKLA